MKFLVFLGLVSLCLAVERFDTPSYKDSNHMEVFLSWKNHFGKQYDSLETEATKFNQFLDNWKMIDEHNSKESSYEMGLNQFGDMSGDEFQLYVHGHMGSCLSERRSWEKVNEYQPSLAKINVPSSVDWTTKGVVTPVKNQGQCGSCWAFSTTGSIESRTAIKTGKLTSLSEQQLVDCSGSYGNMGCNGGLMDYAFEYVKSEGGLCTESAYPYTARDGTCKASTCGTKYDDITGYVDVKTRSESDLQAAVAEGPVSIAIEADQSAFQFYKSGILDGTCGTRLDHGVLAVGYGSQGSQDYWKVKNSWGASWGEDGYVLICRNCNKNGGQGECGILDEPSYPNAK